MIKPENKNSRVLVLIVFSQFACGSTWFAGSAVLPDLINQSGIPENSLGNLISAVQLGFITGTLTYAFLNIADKYSPSKIFFVNAVAGAIANSAIIFGVQGYALLIALRFSTGFFLAGIYPVGMKIASDYFEKGLGKALGYLVGALVLGTAFPHFLRVWGQTLPWKSVLIFTSLFSIAGGFIILFFVPDGPFRKPNPKIDLFAFFRLFRNKQFRSSAFGYFGHMWELYTFWAFVPFIIKLHTEFHPEVTINVSFYSFLIIAIGSLSCVVGGYISITQGSKKTAAVALFISGLCCVVSPFSFHFLTPVFLGFLFIWGMTVVADSPQFSALVAQNAPDNLRGTALTIVNSTGFAITIVSIQFINVLTESLNPQYVFVMLGIGPAFGLISLLIPRKSKTLI